VLADSLSRHEAVGDRIGIADCEAALAGVFLELRDYAGAVEHARRSCELFERQGAYFTLCHAKWLRGDGDAIEHYKAGLDKCGCSAEAITALARDLDELAVKGLAAPEAVAALRSGLGLDDKS
jgi:hypothetical protein